jgi:hypothetical protein
MNHRCDSAIIIRMTPANGEMRYVAAVYLALRVNKCYLRICKFILDQKLLNALRHACMRVCMYICN